MGYDVIGPKNRTTEDTVSSHLKRCFLLGTHCDYIEDDR